MIACHLDRPHKRRTMFQTLMLMMLALAGALGGCTSPPSVAPLLQASERALAMEAAHLVDDAEREAQWIAQSRRSLEQAYDADLAQVEELTPQWVREATRVYVLAREELTRHEAQLREQRRQRAENLHATADAIRRAGAMLQQQDRLWLGLVGVDAWSLLTHERSSGDR